MSSEYAQSRLDSRPKVYWELQFDGRLVPVGLAICRKSQHVDCPRGVFAIHFHNQASVAGNEQKIIRERPYHSLGRAGGVAREVQPVTLDDGLTLWGAAHRAPANTDGFLDGFRVDRSGVHIALFHGAELGSLHFEAEGKQPHAPFREAQLTQAGLHHAFVGHYHRARQTQLITYPGNPEPLSFGEDSGRGAVLATIGGDGSIQRQTYDVAETAVSDIRVDVSGCGSRTEIVTAVEQALKQHRGIVRATIVGDVGADVDVQRSDLQGLRLPDIDACQYQLQLSAAYDLDAITHEKTVRGEFVREVREAQLDPNVERRVLVTGLRALAGRRDLEVS